METEEEYPFLATHAGVLLSHIDTSFLLPLWMPEYKGLFHVCTIPLIFQDPTCQM